MTREPSANVSLTAVGRGAALLTISAALIQLFGITRELFVAAQVGISSELDAFLVATVLPAGAADLLTIGLATALVPAYIMARDSAGLGAAKRVAGAVLGWVGITSLALSVALFVLADDVVTFTGPGLDPAEQAAAAHFARLLAPVTFVSAVGAILQSISQAEERFASIAVAGSIGSFASLTATVVLWGEYGLGALAIGWLLLPTVLALALILSLWKASLMPRLSTTLRGLGLRALVGHAAPLTTSAIIGQGQLIVDRAIATLLSAGAVSSLRFADVLVRLPTSTIGPAWGSALYPALVKATRDEQGGGLAYATDRTLRYTLAAFVPVAMLTAAVAPVAVDVAFGRGEFGPSDVAATAPVVACFAPLIVVLMTAPVLASAHNALRHGRVLLAGGVISLALNFTGDVLLGYPFGAAGIALASSISSTVVTIYFARRLSRAEPEFHAGRIGRVGAVATIASAPAAILIGLFAWSGAVPGGFVPGVVALALFGTTGLMGYAAIAAMIGLEEPRIIASVTFQAIRRRLGSGH